MVDSTCSDCSPSGLDHSWSYGRVVLAIVPATTYYAAAALGSAAFGFRESFVDESTVIDSTVEPVYDFDARPSARLSEEWGGKLPAAVRRDTATGRQLLATALEKTRNSEDQSPHLFDDGGDPIEGRDELMAFLQIDTDDEKPYWLVPGVVRRYTVRLPDGPENDLPCICRSVTTLHVCLGRGGGPPQYPELDRPIWICRSCGHPTYGPDLIQENDEYQRDSLSTTESGRDGDSTETAVSAGSDPEHDLQITSYYDEYGQYPWDDCDAHRPTRLFPPEGVEGYRAPHPTMTQTEVLSSDGAESFETRSFDHAETRSDEMYAASKSWVEDLAAATDEAAASDEFQQWLDVQSRFHDYSARNTLLVRLQRPEATKVAGYQTWRTEFDRHVKEGESAIWIWAPIVTKRCPACENSPSYHEQSDCEYDRTPPDQWREGLVGFRPTTVFDVSQTEGEPLPELDTTAHGEVDGLVEALVDASDTLGFEVDVVDPESWSHGSAKGVCQRRHPMTLQPVVAVKDRPNGADLARTLVHEYAHATLHFEPEEGEEEAKLEVEAEAVAYVVCRHFGLDVENSRFYLAAWDDDAPETLHDRLDRIASTAEGLIDAIELSLS